MKIWWFTLLCVFTTATVSIAQEIVVPESQLSLVTKRTATWCPICGQFAWDAFGSFVDNLSDKALVLAAHHSNTSELYSPAAFHLIENFETSFSQPRFFFNTFLITGTLSDIEMTINQEVNLAYNQVPVAQSGLNAIFDEASGMLVATTRTRFFQPAEGDYYLSLFLVEKEIVGFQSNRGNEAVHKQVLRRAFTENTFGNPIASGSISAGAEFGHQVAIPFNGDNDLGNFLVASLLWKKTEDAYEFINLNYTNEVIREVVGLSNPILSRDNFKLEPNLTFDLSTVFLNVDQNLEHLELRLVNQRGQLVTSLFRGTMEKGIYHFPINRADVGSPGLYFVVLTNGQRSVSRKLIFQ